VNFNFYNPTRIIFGPDTTGRIGGVMAKGGYKKVLLLAGRNSIKKNGVYDTVSASLQKAGIEWAECWGVRPNPVLSKVAEAVGICRDSGAQAVLAVGGGSVIDTAKAVAAGVYLDDVWQAFEGKAGISRALPVFTVLTISGTASEMNYNAVITNEQEGKKWAVSSPLLYPRASIIDPQVQSTLPWQQTVNGGLDALAHIMEHYFMGSLEETTIALNESLMNSIIAMVDRLQADERDTVSRANLAWAATLALNGLSGAGLRGGDWACHAIEHSISCFYPEVAHGAGLGIVFPAWITYVNGQNPDQFRRFAGSVWQCQNISQAVEKMKSKIKQWQGATTLRELGIPAKKLPEIAGNTVARGPVGALKKLYLEDVEKILRLAF